jgi:hypothetical protein
MTLQSRPQSILLALAALAAAGALAVRGPAAAQGAPGAPAEHDMSSMPGMDAAADSAMSHEHMAMGPHMKMTARRPASAADERRAAAVVETVRGAIVKYRDYHAAIADHFIEFAPNVKQPMYHFTNYKYAFEAHSRFDPARPTSLLYKPTPGGGFELIGAMFTAPRAFDENQLDERVPLSVASWHQHVNICFPHLAELRCADWKRFGLTGSIATASDCQAAGGVFHPVVLGWMVHVYPFEADPAKIWVQ